MIIKSRITIDFYGDKYQLEAPLSSSVEDLLFVVETEHDREIGHKVLDGFDLTANRKGETIQVSFADVLSSLWSPGDEIEIQISARREHITVISGPSKP